MDAMFWCLLLFLCTLLFCKSLFLGLSTANKEKKKNLPPSPPPLPILGHLHLLRKPLYRSLAQLSHVYGPVLFLRFGCRPVLVVSSPAASEECFTTNDITFANRPRLLAGKYIGYNYTALPWASYGHHWRNIRRISTLEIFATQRINSFSYIRSEEIKSLVRHLVAGQLLEPLKASFRKVELRSMLFGLTMNIMMRMVTGKRYYGEGVEDKENAEKFQEIVEESFRLAGTTNIGDSLPLFLWMDFQGLEKELKVLKGRRDQLFQAFIDENRMEKGSPGVHGGRDDKEERKTVIDVMLSLQESDPEYYTDDIIKGVMVSLISAGTDTTTVTMEWALSLLLNNPKKIEAERKEIDDYVKPGRWAGEADIPHLPYLQAIVNETLRLYPAAPLLLPHESSENTVVGGFDVPRGTMLIVNAWAIHRDEKVWDKPTKFMPERFLEVSGGGGYKLLPFGSGRRRCPGEGLATRVVSLALATLIQCFDWERVGGVEVDMAEGPGITVPRAVPLEALCKPREAMIGLISQL